MSIAPSSPPILSAPKTKAESEPGKAVPLSNAFGSCRRRRVTDNLGADEQAVARDRAFVAAARRFGKIPQQITIHVAGDARTVGEFNAVFGRLVIRAHDVRIDPHIDSERLDTPAERFTARYIQLLAQRRLPKRFRQGPAFPAGKL